MAPCVSTGTELSFEWSHHTISSASSKVRVTLQNSIKHFGSERVQGVDYHLAQTLTALCPEKKHLFANLLFSLSLTLTSRILICGILWRCSRCLQGDTACLVIPWSPLKVRQRIKHRAGLTIKIKNTLRLLHFSATNYDARNAAKAWILGRQWMYLLYVFKYFLYFLFLFICFLYVTKLIFLDVF